MAKFHGKMWLPEGVFVLWIGMLLDWTSVDYLFLHVYFLMGQPPVTPISLCGKQNLIKTSCGTPPQKKGCLICFVFDIPPNGVKIGMSSCWLCHRLASCRCYVGHPTVMDGKYTSLATQHADSKWCLGAWYRTTGCKQATKKLGNT